MASLNSTTGQLSDAFSWADGKDAPLGVGGESASFSIQLPASLFADWLGQRRVTIDGSEFGPIGTEIAEPQAKRLIEWIFEAPIEPHPAAWDMWTREQRNQSPKRAFASQQHVASRLATWLQEEHPSDELTAFLSERDQRRIEGVTAELGRLILGHRAEPLLNPPVFLPAFRQIRKDQSHDWSGAGLIPLLADLKSPGITDLTERSDKQQRWEAFTRFVTMVLEREPGDISFEIPSTDEQLVVSMDGRDLDIEDLGTGIHELIVIAAAATAHQNTLFLLEEPEIHLHPLLQRKLLDYLLRETSNQYVIATHSAHFLDSSDVAVFRVSLEDGWTEIERVATNTDQVKLTRDLGYRPSDLLQANCVIWVEGPSDRIYIQHWIQSFDSELVEGFHYSIMFYGGGLVSHVSGDETPFWLSADELVELRRINRYSAIVMDSDRGSAKEHVRKNTTKGRVRDEFNKPGGHCWITRGREIENYIDPNTMLQAIQIVHPRAHRLNSTDDYARRWQFQIKDSRAVKACNKVKVAREVVKMPSAAGDVLGRAGEIKKLVQFINDANDPDA